MAGTDWNTRVGVAVIFAVLIGVPLVSSRCDPDAKYAPSLSPYDYPASEPATLPAARSTYGRCEGADNCTACTSCTRCQFCARLGGTCGVKSELLERMKRARK